MRVPYAQHLGKVPFKAVAIVIGAGAAAAAGFAALSWTANASARRDQRTGDPPGAGDGNRLPASQPVAGPGRHRRAAHRDQSRLPRRRQDRHPFRRCRHHRQARRPDRPARSRRLSPGRRQCPRRSASPEADYARAKADHERYLNLRGTAVFTAQTTGAAPVARRHGARRASSRRGASSPRPRTTSPTPSCAPIPTAWSPPCRPRSARSWRRARAWCAWRAPTNSRSWSACPSTA